MVNRTEIEERQYLEDVKRKLRDALEYIDAKVQRYVKEVQEQKVYLWENKTGMDHVEKVSVRQSVAQSVMTGEAVLAKRQRIRKLMATPYFGRFDFAEKDGKPRPVYIGIHAFADEKDSVSLIHDWRAPISTMFYDYETGPARYESPDGTVPGEIVLKRQYRIRNGTMEFMLESDVSIHDEVLQKELSSASDDRMKNIVATIQRDQNAIIRNEKSHVLIIQGVAGSGKTSIALHRIAFLLYRFKEDIKAKDILIISPNKVFADYISNVLPELGEEQIPETGIEDLAKELLERKYPFQTFFEQVTLLLEKDDESFRRRIQAKASLEYLNKLKTYVDHIEKTYFAATDLKVKGRFISARFLDKRFKMFAYLPVFRRLEKMARDLDALYGLSTKDRNAVKTAVQKMFKVGTLRGLYEDFYEWMDAPELLKPAAGGKLEYSDVFPFIYLKMRMEGLSPYDDVKHLLIDEMQDYTPVQYAVIAGLFACKKTILGDANQSVNPFSASSSALIQKVLDNADCVKLCKSYRSTYQITRFAQAISPNADLDPVERHGEEPVVLCFPSIEDEMCEIMRHVKSFKDSGYHAMGIICKTQKQAEDVYARVQSREHKIYLLSPESAAFVKGVVICTAHMAKGLEFDHVIVPDATDRNYNSIIDKSMLYVACTRAMHKLTVTGVKRMTRFIKV